jgi:hypothetical protein
MIPKVQGVQQPLVIHVTNLTDRPCVRGINNNNKEPIYNKNLSTYSSLSANLNA